ncbi:MAG: beta-ketoacyl synthase [Acidobacteria bacterium]|nr:beta-ketoacyl synthase [Acidobacteriota bacterium]MCB9396555.1 beta-ketoacyl synthase [Acidobacteriota bacterium]
MGEHTLNPKPKRIGIFGWGLVAPKSPNIAAFEANLSQSTHWLTPFEGFGPSNFLVGQPEFNFADYKAWMDSRFEPRKFGQLDSKMGSSIKFALGAFIQSLSQNPGIEQTLKDLGDQAHIYVGTGLGELPVTYEISVNYFRAQRRWDRFWCQDAHHATLARYYASDPADKARIRQEWGAPEDPDGYDARDPQWDEIHDAWFHFWVFHSEGLKNYLEELKAIEGEGVTGAIESNKGHLIKRKMVGRKRLNTKYGCPDEPWTVIDPKILWNIPNIAAAQISMLGGITGATIAPMGACSGFGASLRLAMNAIQLGQAKLCVVGTTDPAPHALTVGGFFGARVVSNDGGVSKPFTEMRGTHVAGGACIWLVGDYDYLHGLGMKPLGLEILGVGVTADADHIITPSEDGPRRAIQKTLVEAGAEASDIGTWDMHATATPGDWTELQNALSIFSPKTLFTARKGSFGHGMSACGGWELTAQHLGVVRGELFPVNTQAEEIHPEVSAQQTAMVLNQATPYTGAYSGKINMGVGGINACVICRKWSEKERS